jgi:hypothetical protein
MRQRLSEAGKHLRNVHEEFLPRWMDLLHDMGCSEGFLVEGDGLLLEIMSFKRTSLQVTMSNNQLRCCSPVSSSLAAPQLLTTGVTQQYSMYCLPCRAGLLTDLPAGANNNNNNQSL